MNATRDAGSAEQVIAQARHLINVGRDAEAVPILRRHLASHPDDFECQCLLAAALVRSGELAPALHEADRAVALDPQNEWGHRIRYAVLGRMGKRRQAVAAAREAARLAPQDPHALHALSDALLNGRRRKAAREVAERLLALAPDENLSHSLLGRICMKERRWKEAERHLRRALEIEPDSWTSLNNLGLVLQKLGRRREAIEMLHAAAREAPGESLVRRNLQSSVARYAGGGVLTFWLLWLGSRGFFEDGVAPGTAIVGLVLLATVVGLLAWRQRQRWRSLHPTVRRFYQSERARKRGISWWGVGFLVTFPVVLIWTLLLLAAPDQFLPGTILGWTAYLLFLSGSMAITWRLFLHARRNPSA